MDFLQNLIALPGPETVQHIFFPGLGLEFDLNRVAIVLLAGPSTGTVSSSSPA